MNWKGWATLAVFTILVIAFNFILFRYYKHANTKVSKVRLSVGLGILALVMDGAYLFVLIGMIKN